MNDLDSQIQDLTIELNYVLEALRLTLPHLTRSEALEQSADIAELFYELYGIDQARAMKWVKNGDTLHLREDLYEGSSLPFRLDTLGAVDSYDEDEYGLEEDTDEDS